MKKYLLFSIAVVVAIAAKAQNTWTGTWAAAAEFTGPSDMPKTTLAGKTVRQIIQVSIPGEELQLMLSNEFGDKPVEIKSVYIADALDSCDIVKKSATYLKFNGAKNVTIAPGETATSDVIKYKLKKWQRLSINICYGDQVPEHATSHRGSRTTSFIAQGEVKPGKKFPTMEKVDHWYNIAQLMVRTNKKAIAVLGNSITDGRGSTTNLQNRWPDFLASHVDYGVLNLGIGGNAVVQGGLSQPALVRFDRDILGQKGVDKLIIFEGVNDIGGSRHAEKTATDLINAYKTLVEKAHAAGIQKVYGATITPFKGNGYFTPFHETARQVVNEWIRTSGVFDGVIDFDRLVRDPEDHEKLQKKYSDDWLHLNPEGYKVMGEYAAKVIFDSTSEE